MQRRGKQKRKWKIGEMSEDVIGSGQSPAKLERHVLPAHNDNNYPFPEQKPTSHDPRDGELHEIYAKTQKETRHKLAA